MACDFPRCECLCHPDNCLFLEKNSLKHRGLTMKNLKGKRTDDVFWEEDIKASTRIGYWLGVGSILAAEIVIVGGLYFTGHVHVYKALVCIW